MVSQSESQRPAAGEKDGGEEPPKNLCQMLDLLEEKSREEEEVSVGGILDAVGKSSFGPMLVATGLIAVSPLSGVPTVPSLIGIIVVIGAAQMFVPSHSFWMPGWIRRRSLASERFRKGVDALRPVARFVDRRLRKRLTLLTGRVGSRLIAAACLAVGATMPPLEIVPFLATTAGAALLTFGLAMIARDGLFAAVAFAFTGGIGYLGVNYLLN